MPANTSPIFVLTPKSPSCRVTTANTNLDGSTGTYSTLVTAGGNGAYYKGFRWACQNTAASNGAIRMFIQTGGSGNFELVYEALVPATTFSAGVTSVPQGEWFPPAGIVLAAGSVVNCSTVVSQNFACFLVGGGDY